MGGGRDRERRVGAEASTLLFVAAGDGGFFVDKCWLGSLPKRQTHPIALPAIVIGMPWD